MNRIAGMIFVARDEEADAEWKKVSGRCEKYPDISYLTKGSINHVEFSTLGDLTKIKLPVYHSKRADAAIEWLLGRGWKFSRIEDARKWALRQGYENYEATIRTYTMWTKEDDDGKN